MIDLGLALESIQARASAAASITLSIWGTVKTTSSDPPIRYKLASMELTGGVDTIYTLPKNTQVLGVEILAANSNAADRTLEIWEVEDGDVADASNIFCPGSTIPGKGILTLGSSTTTFL